jgi:hypothetical protein
LEELFVSKKTFCFDLSLQDVPESPGKVEEGKQRREGKNRNANPDDDLQGIHGTIVCIMAITSYL